MNILAMDTSNQLLGVAIVKDGVTLGEHVMHGHRDHSVRLLPAIEQLMKETKTTPADLDRIVVGQGPGSYTGVRISMATAKTMAWALGIDVIGVSSLEALAHQGELFSGYVCPFFDARRGQVYTALYASNSDSFEQTEEIVNPLFSDWLEQLREKGEKILFLSPDIEMYRSMIIEVLGEQAVIPEAAIHYARPSVLAQIGAERKADDLHQIVPNYVRMTEAESNWLKQQEQQK
ncbi:tRNA (adenosine(37)-N6)-threonylcarbamoyltransferase complex dimerization subunit type 1 TsaB [Terribacillus saccharophilus]|uniref:tRNA (adenosine(37)-N6)-threonylcarbamoyltransferase complex dimerization subunit type 1 TsaB n=1 Tax=Terribacillus saccharophilus TaxID=361277 RepID=UPI000C9C7F66|nr:MULTISPECIES: tRNA (adenosine(37)-N6)-threonylcarbamoyltransferase complex dimerization subunit type 1 TsaB [Terribacillus]MCM3225875.1 tRNA (adenosine(37)-N6)-threonylcarbamoyltransferase complex dimerization subunit type 1 TsaB [Terribacillus saccharophilus]